MTYEDFVRLFEEGRCESFVNDETEEVGVARLKYHRLSTKDVEIRMKQKLIQRFDLLLSVRKICNG